MEDLERGRLLAALVAARSLSSFERQQQPLVEIERGAAEKGLRHPL
jgi:hypothetical protein